jgi:hypothetical protein
VVGFHARRLVVFEHDGRVAKLSEPGLFEGHQLTLVEHGAEVLLWIADPGICIHAQQNGNIGSGLELVGGAGRVVLVTLDGAIVQEIPRPPHNGPDEPPPYLPTSVAVDERAFGGSGDVWVADGYGSSRVFRHSADGELIATLDGSDGAGRFDCPHAVFVDRRAHEPRLYIADRGNARVQVYDLEGRFLRSFGTDVLTSPSAFAVMGDTLVVAELHARLALFDAADELIEYIGENGAVVETPGWPNSLDSEQNAVRRDDLALGMFNSPHGVAAGPDGSLYVAEWLIGGRYTKLTRVSES